MNKQHICTTTALPRDIYGHHAVTLKKELVLELEVGLNVLKTNFHAFCLRTDF